MLQTALKDNFETVETEVTECIDLTKWGCAAPGIGGNCRIIDVGGVPNLLDPKHHKTAIFQLPTVAEQVGLKGAYIFGACAASHLVVGVNAELMPTEHISKNCRCERVVFIGCVVSPREKEPLCIARQQVCEGRRRRESHHGSL
mmetsp:Transcript_22512/g.43848  ORF Transcript_22512/g.43848 Transcript_22512/m.43848 type:complete len:144 (-) Transcript_22512:805-1236(-)